VALVLGTNKLLAMAKDTEDLHPIVISEIFFQLINQFGGSFQEHLSPHQFKVSTPRGYETILFGIRTLLDLHLDWVVMQIDVGNAFNGIFLTIIFKEL